MQPLLEYASNLVGPNAMQIDYNPRIGVMPVCLRIVALIGSECD